MIGIIGGSGVYNLNDIEVIDTFNVFQHLLVTHQIIFQRLKLIPQKCFFTEAW